MAYKKFTTHWIFIIENFAFVKHIFDQQETSKRNFNR